MSDPVLDPSILAFYRDRYDEDVRLTRSRHGQLEFRRTEELLRGTLPPAPADVIDIGGGTGVHASWLAAAGYRVRLVDPVPVHVERAGRLAGVSATVGDARALDVADDGADVALLLGPLYHLVRRDDRHQALAEAARVVRPGGLVVVAAISRFAALLELAGLGRITSDAALGDLAELIDTGINHDDPNGFTTGYFHRAEELAAELAAARLDDPVVLGIEGPAAPALDNAPDDRADDVMESAIRCARLVQSEPALMAASPHLLGVARAPMVASGG
jgi:SAM-dependent methyltransferase